MKNVIPAAIDLQVYVGGDWRKKRHDGGLDVVPYDEQMKDAGPYISGAEGWYLFITRDVQGAIDAWLHDLDVISRIEDEQDVRLHKGWFFYNLGRAFHWQGEHVQAGDYFEKARAEDRLTYGSQEAGKFPAAANIGEQAVPA